VVACLDPLQRPGQTAACYSVHGAVARYSILLIPQRHRRRGAGDKQCLSAYSVSAGPFAWRSIRNSWARRPIPPLGTKAWEASSSATTSPRPSGRRWRAATFPRASRRPDRISFSGSEQERAGVARGRRPVYEDHTPYPDGADRERSRRCGAREASRVRFPSVPRDVTTPEKGRSRKYCLQPVAIVLQRM